MDQVDRLRAYAPGVSIEEARDALAEAGDDLLEAVIILERRGKIKPPAGGEKTADTPPPADDKPPRRERANRERPRNETPPGESFSQMVNRFLRFLGRLIHKGNVNKLEVERRGEHIMSLPITLMVIFFFIHPLFWLMCVLLIVGLFFDYRYSFQGPNMGDRVNGVMDSAADTARTIKNDIKDAAEKNHERDNPDR